MPLKKSSLLFKTIIIFLVTTPIWSMAQNNSKALSEGPAWKIIGVKSEPQKREDCAFVEADGKFYLIGGRGKKRVEVFDPVTNEWSKNDTTPIEINHFQGITFNHEIYVVAGMNGRFPHEKPLENIYIYNPAKDQWRKGPEIPQDRRRGSGGTVVYNNKIYLVCGIIDGHFEGTVSWFDEFDPATGKWQRLADAPHARDHFHAAVVNNSLYLAGGRRTSYKTKDVEGQTVPEVDVYDFKLHNWKALPLKDSLPIARAGCTAVTYKGKLIVIGGETKMQESSHNEVDALDTKKVVWTSLSPLVTPRHDTQAIMYKDKIYIVAGSANRGGGPDQSSIEVLELK